MGKDGVALTDSAWNRGSELVMTPYTQLGNPMVEPKLSSGTILCTALCVFSSFVEQPETFGRWKNRFRCLLQPLKFEQSKSFAITFAHAKPSIGVFLTVTLTAAIFFD